MRDLAIRSSLKTIFCSFLASCLAVIAASAQETFSAYTLRADWTNLDATVWDVHGAPRTVPGTFPELAPSVSVNTDGAGKITGAGSVEMLYDDTGVPFSIFVVDITGKISSSTTKPIAAVQLRIKGSGYTVNSSGVATLNNLNLSFKGAPGADPSNPNRTRIVGTLSGAISGPTPLGEKSAKLDGLVAYISASSSDPISIRIDTLENTKKMMIVDETWSGSGSINTRSNTFKLNAKGKAGNKGNSLALTGALGAYTNTLGTNEVAFTAPVSASAKGKISGQVVSGEADSVRADLIEP